MDGAPCLGNIDRHDRQDIPVVYVGASLYGALYGVGVRHMVRYMEGLPFIILK